MLNNKLDITGLISELRLTSSLSGSWTREERGSWRPTWSTRCPAWCRRCRSSAGTGWRWWPTWWGWTSWATRRSWGWLRQWWRTTSRGEGCCWRTMMVTGAWLWPPGGAWRKASLGYQVTPATSLLQSPVYIKRLARQNELKIELKNLNPDRKSFN